MGRNVQDVTILVWDPARLHWEATACEYPMDRAAHVSSVGALLLHARQVLDPDSYHQELKTAEAFISGELKKYAALKKLRRVGPSAQRR